MADIAASIRLLARCRLLSGLRLGHGLLFALIVGLCVINALLIKQNRDLKAAVLRLGEQSGFLKEGEDAPRLEAPTTSGKQVRLNYGDTPKTVLMVFSPQCPASEEVMPLWKEIAAACARAHYRSFGVSLGDGPETNTYLRSHGLSVGTFVGLSPVVTAQYKLSSTPLTLVIDNNGKVEKIWPGVFTEESRPEVERYFGIGVTANGS
jgi:peroxiredoxin